MFITKMAMSRRTLLRGIGATLALPLLDGMVPALTALAKTPGKPAMRLGAIYVPMGMIMENWTPKTTGAGFDLTPIMQPLTPFKSQLTVVSGLNNAGVGHPGAASAFLTDVRARGGANILAGVSMDQLVAQKIGQDNKLPSLELGLESLAMVGDCENANCGYLTTLAYSTPTTPLPAETNPREVFERLFGDPENTTPEKRMERIKSNRSLLDSVTSDISDLQRRIGNGDKAKVNEYLDAVREVERRIQKAESENNDLPPTMEAPTGAPAVYGDHAKLMFDLQALAFQSDSTRVITMMMERETSSRRFPEIGLNEPHHSTTHNPDVAARLENITMINTYQVSLLAVLPGSAGEDAGWRRLAARSLGHPLRFGPERREHPPAREHPHCRRGRRRGHDEGRRAHDAQGRAAREPAHVADGQVRRPRRQARQQHGQAGDDRRSVTLSTNCVAAGFSRPFRPPEGGRYVWGAR